MSTRCGFTLLVVTALSLFLLNGLALSRSEVPRMEEHQWVPNHGPHGDDPDEPPVPDGTITGDDDNWDRPVGPRTPETAEVFEGNGGRGRTAGSNLRQIDVERLKIVFRVQLRMLLRNWNLIFVAR